jgi:imidazole glycerol phosphate synthase glutamine amidotransferase subunit
MTIGVINYGAGNLGSVMNALSRLDAGIKARFVDGPEELVPGSSPFDKIIFPGDGHFSSALDALTKAGYAARIQDWIGAGLPFLGICIGMQVLFEESEEAPGVAGLSVVKGCVKKFPGRKVPQIGWNETVARKDTRLFNGLKNASFFYYIHSYYCVPHDGEITAATTDYYLPYCSALERGNLAAVQFHPEKSGEAGLRLLRNWVEGGAR